MPSQPTVPHDPSVDHPDWCEREHCFAGLEGAASHSLRAANQGRARADVGQEVEWSADSVMLMPIDVTLWIDGDGCVSNLSANDCRDIAHVMLAAADRLEGLA